MFGNGFVFIVCNLYGVGGGVGGLSPCWYDGFYLAWVQFEAADEVMKRGVMMFYIALCCPAEEGVKGVRVGVGRQT